MDIKIVRDSIALTEVTKMAVSGFGDMVKAVVDLKKNLVAFGGELHADAENLLLQEGSQQDDLWGINIYPDRKADELIEYTSLINIRPSQNNRSMEIENPAVRKQISQMLRTMITTP